MMILMMIMVAILIMIMMKQYDYDDDTDHDKYHKNDSNTAAGAVPGASVPCFLFLYHLYRDSPNRIKKQRII